jgi:hypothetical protein
VSSAVASKTRRSSEAGVPSAAAGSSSPGEQGEHARQARRGVGGQAAHPLAAHQVEPAPQCGARARRSPPGRTAPGPPGPAGGRSAAAGWPAAWPCGWPAAAGCPPSGCARSGCAPPSGCRPR